MTEKRTCIKCGEAKPLTEFAYDARNRGVCHECYKAYHKAYYEQQKGKNAHKRKKIDPNKTKVCIKCGLEKPETEYSYDRANARLINTCKACKALITKQNYEANKPARLAYAKEYRASHEDELKVYYKKYDKEHAETQRTKARQWELDHPERVKARRNAYRREHIDEFRERDRKYAEAHKDQIQARYKAWAKANAERLAEYSRQYRAEHADEIKAKRQAYDKANRPRITAYHKFKRYHDPIFSVSVRVRSLIKKSLENRGYSKDTKTYKILGCDFATLWAHLKKTWKENYGTEYNGEPYHIDHIIPLATAKTKQEVLELCYYENLQMLTPHDNLTKNKSLEWSLDKNNKEGKRND